MGEKKMLRKFSERQANGKQGPDEDCEVLIFLKFNNGLINVQFLPRDEEPNQNSPAVILAGYINANLHQLIREAMDGYNKAQAAKNEIVRELPARSILTADGNIARRTDDVALYVPESARKT